MAIKVTTSIDTTKGATTGLYLHITEFYRSKDGSKAQFPVHYYKDDTKADKVTVDNADLPKTFTFDISTEVTSGTDKIEKVAYDKIGDALKTAGFAPESDETESWVAY